MKTIRLMSVLLLPLLFAGCRSTTTTRMFILTGDDTLQRMENTGDIKFELRPIVLPSYLNRREFIKRVGDDEIQILRSNLWAETSEQAINNVFRYNLRALLGEDSMLPHAAVSKNVPILHVYVHSMEMQDDTFVAEFHCRLKTGGAPSATKRLVWRTTAQQGVPYIRYYKQALSELARQTAAWLIETQN